LVKKTCWLILIFLMLVGVTVYVWQPWRRTTSLLAAGGPAEAVAALREINETVLAMGKVLPQVGAEVKVGSRISGRLERLHVKVGDQIEKGRLIAQIEQKDLLAAVAQRQAELALIQARLRALHLEGPQKVAKYRAELAEREAVLRYAASDRKRQHNLWGKKSIPKQAWEEAVRNHEVAMALRKVAQQETELARCQYEQGVVQLKAEVARARAALQDARVQLSYARILSPLAGVVASVSTQEGETVAAGMSAPTFVTVLDLSRLQVDAYVDEVDIGKIKPGQRAWFTVESHPETGVCRQGAGHPAQGGDHRQCGDL
jgi:HlyD family secretion protein